ncbi:helix-turn-helix domain-containing protein [Nocardia sp. alder85J]|uniref:helix-turn-helix domain-containing protein n=1 Tax=Nocardia sp. alder85J TaxID=2862949 RepID=UPI001CD5FF96|nr:helix-turn-helix transcriptional regulator [Nocardia sp. alder85J]MCX4092203.1 helix-turn-helix transcriptional regulator [Nocardia sp. alder85J]
MLINVESEFSQPEGALDDISGVSESRAGADGLSPRQAAAAVFSSRLSELIAESVVSTEDGSTRSLTLYSLAQHLELAYPDVPVSQSGLYRLIHGEAIPRLDLIIALARVFDVPPEYFVTAEKKR